MSGRPHPAPLIPAALAAIFLGGPNVNAQDGVKKEPCIIGTATMESDQTIVVRLHRTCDGMNVSGSVQYSLSSPHYKKVLDHLGGMKPGETKLVPAYED